MKHIIIILFTIFGHSLSAQILKVECTHCTWQVLGCVECTGQYNADFFDGLIVTTGTKPIYLQKPLAVSQNNYQFTITGNNGVKSIIDVRKITPMQSVAAFKTFLEDCQCTNGTSTTVATDSLYLVGNSLLTHIGSDGALDTVTLPNPLLPCEVPPAILDSTKAVQVFQTDTNGECVKVDVNLENCVTKTVQAVVSATNTIQLPADPDIDISSVQVNVRGYHAMNDSDFFTISGSTLTWNTAVQGFDVLTTDDVYITYRSCRSAGATPSTLDCGDLQQHFSTPLASQDLAGYAAFDTNGGCGRRVPERKFISVGGLTASPFTPITPSNSSITAPFIYASLTITLASDAVVRIELDNVAYMTQPIATFGIQIDGGGYIYPEPTSLSTNPAQTILSSSPTPIWQQFSLLTPDYEYFIPLSAGTHTIDAVAYGRNNASGGSADFQIHVYKLAADWFEF
ncbi:MAG: hypothetical protein WAS72_05840 [Saprospiraceae bacterium]